VSPDGRWLVYDSDRRGNADIYRLRLDQAGAEPEQLTADSANDYSAAISPDGKELLFHSLRTGNRDLWVMGIDGTNPGPVTHSKIEEYAGTWSPDGRSAAYYADSAATIWLGVVSRDAQGSWGTPQLLLPKTANPAWSPNGNRLAALHDNTLAVITLPEKTVRTILPVPQSFQQGTRQVVWARDGRIYFRVREPDGRLSLVSLSPDGGPPTVLVRPRDASRAGPRADWFTDGRRLYFTMSRYDGDVSIVEIR
jgi:Tol biopolymer transport system component